MYCEKCDSYIDTDYNAEHFDDEVNGCETMFEKGTDKWLQPLTALNCKRCDYKWYPRTVKEPKNCPKCNSPYWNKERIKALQDKK